MAEEPPALPDVVVYPAPPLRFPPGYIAPPPEPVDWLAIWGWTPEEIAEFDRC